MAELDFKYTGRGFKRAEFVDLYGATCSIQESSLATDEAIWLGCEREQVHHITNELCGARMHLNREQVASLLPVLQRFVKTGELPEVGGDNGG